MSTVLMLLACHSPPYVFSEAGLKDDGVHVKVGLTNIDSVEIEGQSLADGQSMVLPVSLFHIGQNRLPILGEGLEGETLYLELRMDQVLELQCSGSGDGRVRIRLQDQSGFDTLSANDCAVGEGGYVTGKLGALTGSTILIDGQEVDGSFRLDARSGLWEQPLVPFKVGKDFMSSKEYQVDIVVRHTSGSEWSGVVTYKTGSADLMGTFIQGLPESAQGMPAGDAVALRWQNGWRFAGTGQLGQLARFGKVVDESEPRFIATCHYQRPGGGPVNIKTVAVDRTVAVVDRQGAELGRRVFKAKTGGYSCSKLQYEGGGDVGILPDHQAILAWAQAL
ncbi:MAG: hypothetical protein ACI9VR_001673 [Cognaticolwellia sp.]|jgi:hypothetical protein